MKFAKRNTWTLLTFIWGLTTAIRLGAHAPDQSYLYLRIYGDAIGGRVELTAKDINRAIGTNIDRHLTNESISPYLTQIHSYISTHTKISSPEAVYSIQFKEPEILNLEEMDDFVRFHFDLGGVKQIPDYLDIDYSVMFDVNALHRGMLIVEYNWKAGVVDNHSLVSHIFSPGNTKEKLSLLETSIWKGFKSLIGLGIWHIWIGLDHILFLVALILPAVVRRRKDLPATDVSLKTSSKSIWVGVDHFRPAFWYILKIVTFFTIAHSITLAMAALNIINLPSRIVESIIALSIALAAFHNIVPIFKAREWLVAFGFGLFHGFGFAGVLGEKGLSGDFLVLSLLGFNLGVEIGQVAIICAIFPILFFIRKLKFYSTLITYGSGVLIFISLYWAIERLFEVDLPLGGYFWKAWDALAQLF